MIEEPPNYKSSVEIYSAKLIFESIYEIITEN